MCYYDKQPHHQSCLTDPKNILSYRKRRVARGARPLNFFPEVLCASGWQLEWTGDRKLYVAVQRSHAWRCMYARATCVRAHPTTLNLTLLGSRQDDNCEFRYFRGSRSTARFAIISRRSVWAFPGYGSYKQPCFSTPAYFIIRVFRFNERIS